MRYLVIGSGGREHALVVYLSKCHEVEQVFAIPGNPGMVSHAQCESIELNSEKGFTEVLDWIDKESIDLTVVGPELPLADGFVDCFYKRFGKNRDDRLVFGPTQKAAQLEWSKAFSKAFMVEQGIPTAQSILCHGPDEVTQAVEQMGLPIVLKADGLTAGKGVLLCHNQAQYEAAHRVFFEEKRFGSASEHVLVERLIIGEEVSCFAICDGERGYLLSSSQDHKTIFDGDQGPNTGGMGAYSPAPLLQDKDYKMIEQTILIPTLRGMKEQGNPYRGILYIGLMITETGPQVLEYNCRFGDPECQVLLPRLDCSLALLIKKACLGTMDASDIKWKPDTACCVVLASGGYPEDYEKGKIIAGLKEAELLSDVTVFHAGTKLDQGTWKTQGGRVLGVTALADDLPKAIQKAYEGVDRISWDGMHYRTDIGQKGLKEKTP